MLTSGVVVNVPLAVGFSAGDADAGAGLGVSADAGREPLTLSPATGSSVRRGGGAAIGGAVGSRRGPGSGFGGAVVSPLRHCSTPRTFSIRSPSSPESASSTSKGSEYSSPLSSSTSLASGPRDVPRFEAITSAVSPDERRTTVPAGMKPSVATSRRSTVRSAVSDARCASAATTVSGVGGGGERSARRWR